MRRRKRDNRTFLNLRCTGVLLAGAAGCGLIGCASASAGGADGGKGAGGDASINGRSDASQGIRPDAAQGILPDAGPAGGADAAGSVDAGGSCTTGPTNLLANGDFDLGPSLWTESSGGGFPLITDAADITGVTADSGSFISWLGGYSPVGGAVDTFEQDLLVPTDATPITMSGKLWVDSAESDLLSWDTLTLEIIDASSGNALETIGSWSNMDQGTTWETVTADLSSTYAGQNIRLRWTADVDSSNNTSFLLDTLALTTTTCQ